mmetsp:Transcript_75724/g.204774  ORF Transcript_75724/g.204774 Transcript_75724/m.204774 type:complete len:298 (+) Transcript_75724:307-1200(+)
MEYGFTNSAIMILQRLVRLRTKVQVEPDHAPVVRAHHHVVAAWVHGDGRDPLGATHQLLQVLLLLKVVYPNARLRRHEEVRLTRVECTALHLSALQLREGPHGLLLGDRVDDAHVGGALRLGAHRRAVIALHVPGQLLDVAVGRQGQPAAAREQHRIAGHRLPPHRARLAALGLGVLLGLRRRGGGLPQHERRRGAFGGTASASAGRPTVARALAVLALARRCRWRLRRRSAVLRGVQAGVQEEDGLLGRHAQQGVARVPRDRRRHGLEPHGPEGPAGSHLPDPQRLVRRHGREPLP